MALLYEGVRCTLCGEVIDLDSTFFCSSAVPDPSGDGCLEHSDAPIHWSCLFAWDQVDVFLHWVYEAHRAFIRGNEYWTTLVDDEQLVLAHNGMTADLCIAGTGLGWQVELDEWPEGLEAKRSSPELRALPADRQLAALSGIDAVLALLPRWQADS